MAQTKSRPITNVKAKKNSKTGAELIKQYTGRDLARLPAGFKKILVEEIKVLRPPLATPKYPFKSVRPPAEDSEYVQTGLGGYLFKDVDYAIIRFLFSINNPSEVSKSRLKDLLVNRCNVPHSELEKCSWPDIREFLLSDIEVKYDSAGESGKEPDDLITLSVAANKYFVRRLTLQRAIQDGRLRSYRPENCARNHPHKVRESEVASIWTPKGS